MIDRHFDIKKCVRIVQIVDIQCYHAETFRRQEQNLESKQMMGLSYIPKFLFFYFLLA